MEIRSERPTDVAAISYITTAAFKTAPHSSGTEARIVEGLRTGQALAVSLVAVDQDEIVGHVAFSPVTIVGARGGWYGLGPVSVRPEQQSRGFGQLLIRAGLEQLRLFQAAGCVVLGDPRYYHRFGFESDPALTYGGRHSPYFQRLVLGGPPATGDVAYHPAFGA
ncbi:N-acetyltransferase [Bradyrhizobium sp. LHD-71]|uniref:GNAT family N-acetyltransferase n=1 Tax=Bradyrhizobium sp. LHD-71 TaxID=3072141 RepID=UPI00280FCBCB|nr:N-acetyltransferase [Bradyrhizobium sp. LHD-71]MDQ8730748.1 N-acetyltransferase [Bradyrhizobium sp. LHD-71]